MPREEVVVRGMRQAASEWETDNSRKLVDDVVRSRQSGIDDILPSHVSRAWLCAWRRLHVRRHRVRTEEDAIEDVRVV